MTDDEINEKLESMQRSVDEVREMFDHFLQLMNALNQRRDDEVTPKKEGFIKRSTL